MEIKCSSVLFLSRTKGFTLIELLVVVLIMGILAAVAVPQYNKIILKSRILDAAFTTRAIAAAEDVYFLSNSRYTTDFNELDLDPKLGTGGWRRNANADYNCGVEMGGTVGCTGYIKGVLFVIQSSPRGKRRRLSCTSYSPYKADVPCSFITGASSWREGCSAQRSCHTWEEP